MADSLGQSMPRAFTAIHNSVLQALLNRSLGTLVACITDRNRGSRTLHWTSMLHLIAKEQTLQKISLTEGGREDGLLQLTGKIERRRHECPSTQTAAVRAS